MENEKIFIKVSEHDRGNSNIYYYEFEQPLSKFVTKELKRRYWTLLDNDGIEVLAVKNLNGMGNIDNFLKDITGNLELDVKTKIIHADQVNREMRKILKKRELERDYYVGQSIVKNILGEDVESIVAGYVGKTRSDIMRKIKVLNPSVIFKDSTKGELNHELVLLIERYRTFLISNIYRHPRHSVELEETVHSTDDVNFLRQAYLDLTERMDDE